MLSVQHFATSPRFGTSEVSVGYFGITSYFYSLWTPYFEPSLGFGAGKAAGAVARWTSVGPPVGCFRSPLRPVGLASAGPERLLCMPFVFFDSIGLFEAQRSERNSEFGIDEGTDLIELRKILLAHYTVWNCFR